MSKLINIVFEQTPSGDVFVAVEDLDGNQLNVGEWIDLEDCMRALQIRVADRAIRGEPANVGPYVHDVVPDRDAPFLEIHDTDPSPLLASSPPAGGIVKSVTYAQALRMQADGEAVILVHPTDHLNSCPGCKKCKLPEQLEHLKGKP